MISFVIQHIWITQRTYSLAERSALANGNLVTLLNTEGGGDVGGQVLVALLVTGVLGDEVEVLAADDESSVHLGGNDGAGQDTATDRDETGEGALLVCNSRGMSVSVVAPDCPYRPKSILSSLAGARSQRISHRWHLWKMTPKNIASCAKHAPCLDLPM